MLPSSSSEWAGTGRCTLENGVGRRQSAVAFGVQREIDDHDAVLLDDPISRMIPTKGDDRQRRVVTCSGQQRAYGGVGALLRCQVTNTPLTIIAFVGIILLIGIVKKNGIMIVDFALDAERHRGLSSADAIFEAAAPGSGPF